MVYTILFLHLLTTADSQQSSSIDNVDKINSGFHATAMANIEIASDVWIHTVSFNLPQATVRDSLNQRLSSSQYDSIVL
jgi:transketolase